MPRTRIHQRLGAFGFTAVVGVMGAGALVRSCAPAAPSAPAAPAAPRAPVSAPMTIASPVVDLVNQQRAAAGLPALAENGPLDSSAIGQSTDQATRRLMTHAGANGSDAGVRISWVGYRWRTWGENVAAGQTTADQVMGAWMASAGHRANILNPAFTDIGIAAVQGADGVIYWTMDLAAPR
jgi:uncharacterized protein YkwD